MARRVNFIEEITDVKDTWKIRVGNIGLWHVDRSSAPSLEMIFMDEKMSLEITTNYDPEYMAYLTPKKKLASNALFAYDQDLAFAQMSSTKNAKNVDNE
ncbi:hypothetical protein Lal_00025843 [Lupinus albus]|nr:hypothetical protein Lal_00025843 [Lupinus albus]